MLFADDCRILQCLSWDDYPLNGLGGGVPATVRLPRVFESRFLITAPKSSRWHKTCIATIIHALINFSSGIYGQKSVFLSGQLFRFSGPSNPPERVDFSKSNFWPFFLLE